jgi:nitrous oxidase accessory protein
VGGYMFNKNSPGKIVVVLFFGMIIVFNPVLGGMNDSPNQQQVTTLFGNILYVGGSGPGNFTKIQDAIDNASGSDTVFVYDISSPYYENVIIDRSISLMGEDKDYTVIDGDLEGVVVTITANDVFVSGFTLTRPEDDPSIDWESNVVDLVHVENVTVKDNIIIQNQLKRAKWYTGILLRDSSNCLIQGNTVKNLDNTGGSSVGIGVLIGASFNNVSGNEIHGFSNGVFTSPWTSGKACIDNIIEENYVHGNVFGIYDNYNYDNKINYNIIANNDKGIVIMEGNDNIISGNTVTNNGDGDEHDSGIRICGDNNQVSNNHVSGNNPTGVLLVAAEHNYVTNNDISSNGIGVFCDSGYNNIITNNNFVQNDRNGYFEMIITFKDKNIWDGNYWDQARTKPYLIFGISYFLFFTFPWINIDWNPAQEPYDI